MEQFWHSRVSPTWRVPWFTRRLSITKGSSRGMRYLGSPTQNSHTVRYILLPSTTAENISLPGGLVKCLYTVISLLKI